MKKVFRAEVGDQIIFDTEYECLNYEAKFDPKNKKCESCHFYKKNYNQFDREYWMSCDKNKQIGIDNCSKWWERNKYPFCEE